MTMRGVWRGVLYGLMGVVLSAYAVLFVLVVSRHIDRGAHARRSTQQDGRCVRQPTWRRPPGPTVALASFPGSGNTWIRFLVQQATGYLTGSVYRDYSLKRNGFPGESVANGSVLLVKTHEWGKAARGRFEKAVLLVRQPQGALLAEFHRRAAGHVGHAAPHKFLKGNGWCEFVRTHSRLWMESVLDWLQFEGPLLVLRYEEVAADLPRQLRRLLRFLGAPADLRCVLRHRDGLFRRPRRPLPFDPFEQPPLRALLRRHAALVEDALRNASAI